MAARTSPTFRRRRLARRVRQLREQAGLTQEEAAQGLDMSTSALSRKENGDVCTTVHEIRSMMDLYDLYDPELVELARAAKARGWWRAYGIEDRGYVDLETEACRVHELSLMCVPGLLQTEDYMRAIFEADRAPRSQQCLENDVTVRKIRQQRLLDCERAIQLTAVLDQAALERPIGGPAVMRDQLKHLLVAVAKPSVNLRLLPKQLGWHAGLEGAFVLLGFPEQEDPDVLFVSHPAGSIHIDKDAEVAQARSVFEHLLGQTLSVDATCEAIEQAARMMSC